jgi:uncharacterized damage-inducible protein DinB
MIDPRYPIGRPSTATPLTPAQRQAAIGAIEHAPALLRRAVSGLNDEQLDTPYREGGWTVRQLVHHVADSHINAYTRFRFALTEDNPTVKGYDENLWAQLSDAATAPIGPSLALIDALHVRWTILLRSLEPKDFARPFLHSASGPHDVDWLLAIYAWHGAHHAAHITALRTAKGW